MATAKDMALSGDPLIDGIMGDSLWEGVVSYGFPDAASDYPAGYGDEPSNDFFPISQDQQRVIRTVVAQVEAFTNLSFQYAGAQTADLAFAQSSLPPTAYAYSPGSGGDVWFGTASDYRSPRVGDYAYQTHFHEIGHALGLKHPHDFESYNPNLLDSKYDWLGQTVMSYRSYAGGPLSYTAETFGFPTTFMPLDILALQYLYGADFTTNSGNTTYKWDPETGTHFVNGVAQPAPGSGTGVVGDVTSNRIFMAVWDGGGQDTYDLSNYTTNLVIRLEPGESSTFSAVQRANLGDGRYADNVYNAYLFEGDRRSLIENATGGSGHDWMSGNIAANILVGGLGSDIIDGRGGADSLSGGAGDDALTGGFGDDSFNGGAGNDTIGGGAGIDRASYVDSFHDYLIYAGRDGQMKIGAVEGLDTVGVENVRFADRTIALDDYRPFDKTAPSLIVEGDNRVYVSLPAPTQPLDFGEAVDPGSGTLRILYSDGQLYRSYTASELLVGRDGIGSSFQLDLPDDPGNYYVEIDPGFVVDQYGNASAGLFGPDAWNFKIGGVDDFPSLPQYRSNQDPSFVWADANEQYSYPTLNLSTRSSYTISGYLNGGDEDSHQLNLDPTKTYVITWESLGPNGADGGLTISRWGIDPVLNRNYGFFSVAETTDKLIFQPRSYGGGSAYFVSAAGGAGAYRFTISEWEGGDDFVNDNEAGEANSTATLAIGAATSGIIAAHGNTTREDGSVDWPWNTYNVSTPDTDWMKVELVAGRTYSFTIRTGSLDDPDIDTVGTFGLQLLRNYVVDGEPGSSSPYASLGSGPNFTFTATETGTHWLRVTPGSDRYGEASYGGYTVRVDEGVPADFDDVAPTFVSTAVLGSDGPLIVTLTFSEKIVAGSGMIRLNGPGGWLDIDVRDETQVSWSGSALILRPDVERFPAGVTTISLPRGVVTDLAGNGFEAETTTSFAIAGGAAGDDFSAGVGTAGALGLGDDLLAGIGADEADGGDWFKMSLQGGVTYDLRVVTEGYAQYGFGPSFDARLKVRDAAGNLVVEDLLQSGGGGNARLLFKPAASGTYFIEVASAGGSGLYLVELLPFGTGIVKTGGSFAERLDGTPFADTLDGMKGDDLLDGRGGNDTLRGGDGADLLAGGTGDDVLEGGAGADRLVGGKGTDQLTGGAGNDTYVLDSSPDKIVEAAGGGIDLVESSVTHTLGAEVENLLLTGGGAINGIGNAAANVLTGNFAANRLEGGAGNDTLDGAAGADTMVGGAGNDVYRVDSLNDSITEGAGGGTDTVQSTISWTLGAEIERLVL
nr:M10 family metallopeptidase C-terminal domain-containing protein [Pseudomonadota bacterium]